MTRQSVPSTIAFVAGSSSDEKKQKFSMKVTEGAYVELRTEAKRLCAWSLSTITVLSMTAITIKTPISQIEDVG
jgi:hypothetical protein